MEFDIYFHDDFDGMASAAVMLYFLEQKGNKVKNYFPLKHDIKPTWEKLKFRRPSIVLDFLYHPEATYWFDHHNYPFITDGSFKNFKANSCKVWDKDYKSCCRLVVDSLKKNFNFDAPEHIKELGAWLDVIDGAQYDSAEQAVKGKEPAIRLGLYIGEKKEYSRKRIVKLLAKESLKKITAVPDIKKTIVQLEKNTSKLEKLYKKQVLVNKDFLFMDLGVNTPKSGFMPYYIYPDSKYAMFLRKHGRVFHISLGANPWKKYSGPHIGEYLKDKFGGGGHRMVGGAELRMSKAEAYKTCMAIVQDFIKKQ